MSRVIRRTVALSPEVDAIVLAWLAGEIEGNGSSARLPSYSTALRELVIQGAKSFANAGHWSMRDALAYLEVGK